MGLDTEDMKLITGLQSEMEGRILTAIKGVGSNMMAKIESEVNRIEVLDALRNGKIEDNEKELKLLKKETKIARWIQKNKRNSIIIIVVTMLIVAFSYHSINFKRTIERIMKIELNEAKIE